MEALAVIGGLVALALLAMVLALRSYRREGRTKAEAQVSHATVKAYQRFGESQAAERRRTRSERIDRLLRISRRRRAAGAMPGPDPTGSPGAGQDGDDR